MTTQDHIRAIHEADQRNAAKRDERAASADGMTASERAMAKPYVACERSRCVQIDYVIYTRTQRVPFTQTEEHRVTATGRGRERQIVVRDVAGNVVWSIMGDGARGPLTSRAAASCVDAYLKGRTK